jgi:hypothetical protein
MRAARIGMTMALLSACAASQQQADEALKSAEGAMTAQHADAIRFAPEEFRVVMASYDSARTAYEAEDWGAVVAVAGRTVGRARQLAPAIARGKEQAAARWPAVRDSVSAMLTALSERLADVQRTHDYPAGMTAMDLRAAQARIDTLTTGLQKAQRGFEMGDLTGALHAADRVRAQAGTLMASIGLRPRNPHGM